MAVRQEAVPDQAPGLGGRGTGGLRPEADAAGGGAFLRLPVPPSLRHREAGEAGRYLGDRPSEKVPGLLRAAQAAEAGRVL
jgi:hypothetical protein